ncbi:MAG TPA: hypothetical protein VIH59_22615 [Candidatus Tectomicrobia bacterium]
MSIRANVPEVLDLARATRRSLPGCFLFVGGHSALFIAPDLLRHAQGAISCVVRGEGEVTTPRRLEVLPHVETLPGMVTEHGMRPPPLLLNSLDQPLSRGCPWDCAFCSAWTF